MILPFWRSVDYIKSMAEKLPEEYIECYQKKYGSYPSLNQRATMATMLYHPYELKIVLAYAKFHKWWYRY